MKGKKTLNNFRSTLSPYPFYTIIEELEDRRIYWFGRDCYWTSTREFRDQVIHNDKVWEEQFKEWGRTGPIISGELVMELI